MKAANKSTGSTRSILFSELPETSPVPSLQVNFDYSGDSSVLKAAALDKFVIPAVLESINNQGTLSKPVDDAIVTVLQLLSALKKRQIEAALEAIDLSDEAWEDELAVLKEAVGWEDD